MIDKMLLAQLEDAAEISKKRPHFIGFLNEEEWAAAEDYLRGRRDISYTAWGGFPQAHRRLAGFFPPFQEPNPQEFPLRGLTFRFSKQVSLSHRDFLGAFMALGVERSAVGDILIEEGRCVAFVRSELLLYFESNLTAVGKTAVAMTEGFDEPLPSADSFAELSGVVASQRLDGIVALLMRTSREKAANFVKAGHVSVNHREITSGARPLQEGDIVSIRKCGRFIIDRLGPLTAKGRMKIQCRKYQ